MKFLKPSIFMLFLLIGFLWFGQSHAAAASWCGVMAPATQQSSPPSNYDCLNYGQDYSTCTVLAGSFPSNCASGLSSDQLKNQFINRMHNFESSNQHFQVVGAKTIESKLYTHNDMSWEARLNMSDIEMKIVSYQFSKNSAYDPAQDKDITYDDPLSHEAVIFKDANSPKVYFAIKLDCGNFEGTLPGLPKPADWSLTSKSQVWTTSDTTGWSSDGANEDAVKTDAVKFRHKITNQGPDDVNAPDTPDITWRVEGCYHSDGSGCQSADFGPNVDGGGCVSMLSGSDGNVPDGGDVKGGWIEEDGFSFGNCKPSAAIGARYCQRIAYDNGNGPDTTPNYGAHSNASCAVLKKPGTPDGTIACSTSAPWTIFTTTNIDDSDHDGPYQVDVWMDGSTKIVSKGTTSALGAYSTVVDPYVPPGSSHTFFVTIYGVDANGNLALPNGKTNTVTCGAAASGTGCPTFNPATRTVTLTPQNVPQSTPDLTDDGYSASPGQTAWSYTANGNYKIEDVTDGYQSAQKSDGSTGWSPTGETTNSATFTIYYDRWIKDYPYDDHDITVKYDTYYNIQKYVSSNTATPTCPNGGSYSSTDFTCHTAASSYTTTVPASCSPYNVYSDTQCVEFVAPNSNGTCPAGYTPGFFCYKLYPRGTVTGTAYYCTYGTFSPSGIYCYYTPTYLYRYQASGAPQTDQGPAVGTTSAPQLPECYDRGFTINGVNVTVGLSPTNEDPDTAGSSSNVSVSFFYPAGYPQNALGFHVPAKVTLSYNSSFSGCTSGGGSSGSVTVTGGNGPGTTTVPAGNDSCQATAPPLTAGQSVCATYTFSPPGSQMKADGTITVSSPGSVSGSGCSSPVSNQPYAHFWGLDVSAGGAFESRGDQCITTPAQQSGIEAFVRGTGPLTRGSGAQFGALALGAVATSPSPAGFGSAILRSSTPTGRDGLTFANNGALGSMGLSNHCVPDYFANNPVETPDTSGTSISLAAFNGAGDSKPKQLYYGNGTTNYTVDGFSGAADGIDNGNDVAIYVDGDVYIQNDIRFKNTSWSSTDQIPSFYLIVKGNIYISKNVHQLDGVYVAEPNGDSDGTINTCANNFSRYSNAELFNNCSSQLVVNGAFIAQNVELNRTYASLRNSIGGEYPLTGAPAACLTQGDKGSSVRSATNYDCAAEVFNFSPEAYLAPPGIPATSDPNSGRFDYITSLSPVL